MRSYKGSRQRAGITGVLAIALFAGLSTQPSWAATWSVGPERALKIPSAAAKRARPGDIVEIDAGNYRNDYAVWYRDNITIRGLGNGAHLTSNKLIPNGKAIWVVRGRNTVIENIEFSGARVKQGNGAGGHHVKSRAAENYILYNRLEDDPSVPTSRLIDLSNCGKSFIIGNELFQAKGTRNINAIGYGPEQCDKRSPEQKQLFVVNNTLVNESFNGVLVRNHANTEVTVANNLIIGPGKFLTGGGDKTGNVKLGKDKWRADNWLPVAGSGAIDAARPVSGSYDVSLVPQREFRPPAGTTKRELHGTLDVGARELTPQS